MPYAEISLHPRTTTLGNVGADVCLSMERLTMILYRQMAL